MLFLFTRCISVAPYRTAFITKTAAIAALLLFFGFSGLRAQVAPQGSLTQVTYITPPAPGQGPSGVIIPSSQWGIADKYAISFPRQSCGNLKSLRIEARLDTGPDHAAAFGSTFTTSQQVTVTVSSTGGQVTPSNFKANLSISQAQPEQWRLLDAGRFLGSNSAANEITVRVSVPTAATSTGNAPGTQRIVVRCIPEYETYAGSTLVVQPNAVAVVAGYEQTLNWTSNCSLVNSYQIQLVHRPIKVVRTGNASITSTASNYSATRSPDPAEFNTKGLLIETGSATTSYTLSLAEGEGTYHWRVRAIGNQPGGVTNKANWGTWTVGPPFSVTAPDAASNWIYSRTFSEQGHVAEKLTFANGLQQVRQTQTRLATPTQSTTELGKQVVAVQTLQDFAGRDAVTSLPIPLQGADAGKLGFKKELLVKAPRLPYEAADFDKTDLSDASKNTAREPSPAIEQGYYSRTNDRIADSEGYPFSRTIFSNDGTNRVIEQGGVGAALRVKGNDPRTVRTSYASVTPAEVVRLFGKEAPLVDGLYKVITTDPNNVSSVTYQTKDGKTIATALSGGADATGALVDLPSYANSKKTVTERIEGRGQLISRTITLTAPTTRITGNYGITPSELRNTCANYCASCDYQILLRIIDVNAEPGSPPFYNNPPILVRAGEQCNAVYLDLGGNSVDLPAGTYRIERELVPAGTYPIASNTAYVGPSSTTVSLAQHLDKLRLLLTPKVRSGTLWTTIDSYLAANDVVGLYQYLDGAFPQEDYNGQLSYKISVAGCDDFVYIPRLTDYCPAPIDLSAPKFAEKLDEAITALNQRYPNSPQSATALLAAEGYTFSQFNELVKNMANESYYTNKQELINCWDGVLNTLEASLYEGLGTTSGYQPQLIREYLQCTGVNISEPRDNVASFDNTRAYKQFLYDPNNTIHQNCIAAVGLNDNNPSLPIPTWQQVISNFINYDLKKRNEVFNCLRYNSNTTNPATASYTQAEAQALAAQMTKQGQDACDNRREEFRQVIVMQLHQQGRYIETDEFVWTSNASGVPVMTQTQLPANTPRTTSCEIDVMVQALVEQCQKDCVVNPVVDNSGRVVSIGTAPELLKLKQVMFASLKVYIRDANNTTPPSSYILVPAATKTTFAPVNKTRIISFEGFVDPRQWTKYAAQKSKAIFLRANQRYYVEVLHKNGDGPDNLALGWQLPGSQVIDGPISGNYLSPFETTVSQNAPAGTVLLERWKWLNSSNDVATVPTYTTPTDISYPSLFEATTNYYSGSGSRMRGYITAPLDGDYFFYLASDDNGEVWIAPTCPPLTGQELYYGWGDIVAEIKDPRLGDPDQPVFEPAQEACNVVAARQLRTALAQEKDRWIQSQLTAFTTHFEQQCVAMATQQENFTITYDQGYHHFTLYYYDRAGNLIKTVPPAGVVPLDLTEVQVAALLKTDRSTWPVTQHRLATIYTYNSLHQLEKQSSPDGGETHFFYNRKGQLRFSQNARQRTAAMPSYSYTRYDALGRVTEVGESYTDATAPNASGQELPYVLAKLEDMNFPPADEVHQVTRTGYGGQGFTMTYQGNVQRPQRYLTNRVAYSYYDVDGNPGSTRDNSYTYYSYDPHGNVEWLAQEQYGLGRKFVRYKYDLISNKVTQVLYQEGQPDQFYHRYSYDADNRLTLVQTSVDSMIWDQDARYTYFAHGPLKRLELGEDHVQGIDYTYTLQGWLKGINLPGQDPGQDGTSSQLTAAAADAFGMTLGYFAGDFTTNNTAWLNGANSVLQPVHNLYNGNIAAWTSKNRVDITGAPTSIVPTPDVAVGERYRYDQLNRLVSSNTLNHNPQNQTFAATDDYGTGYSYEPNGNLLSLTRKGAARLGQLDMDQLSYNYNTPAGPGNQLQRVNEATPNHSAYLDDIKFTDPADKSPQYSYDAIGNLIRDATSEVTNIQWNVYGKIERVTQSNYRATLYGYDAQGNRIRKSNSTGNGYRIHHTYYVRDAQGNVLAVYEQDEEDETPITALSLIEQPIYGSSRLGMRKLVAGATPMVLAQGYYARTTGQKQYELVDHLGNVRALVGDTKRPSDATEGFKPDLLAYYNYYPFGMLQPGRTAPSTPTNNGGYRYGFNGKEKDNNGEIGLTNYDYGFRIYNPGIAKFLSVDPLSDKFPWYTPYQFAGNNPIQSVDLDGQEEYHYMLYFDKKGDPHIKLDHVNDLKTRSLEFNFRQGLHFVTNINQEQSYIVHTGVYYEGTLEYGARVNFIKEEISFIYSSKKELNESVVHLSKSAINNRLSTYKNMNMFFKGLNNVGEEMQQGHIPFTKSGSVPTNVGGSRSINPKRGNVNCAGCAEAGDATLKGFPASALVHGETLTSDVAAAFGKTTWYTANKMNDIVRRMQEAGEGSTGIIFGYRGRGRVGHYFNVTNENGRIIFLDFQKSGSAKMSTSEISDFKDLWFINTTPK